MELRIVGVLETLGIFLALGVLVALVIVELAAAKPAASAPHTEGNSLSCASSF